MRAKHFRLYLFIAIILILVLWVVYTLINPRGYAIYYISKSPFKSLNRFEWDVSSKQDGSVNALFHWTDEGYAITVSGEGKMIDFDRAENRVAWNSDEFLDMTVGYYVTPDVIIINDGVTYVGQSGFSDFTHLKKVILPSSLKTIGEGAFLNCIEIGEIQYAGTIDEWNSIEFGEHWNKGTAINKIICSDGTMQSK